MMEHNKKILTNQGGKGTKGQRPSRDLLEGMEGATRVREGVEGRPSPAQPRMTPQGGSGTAPQGTVKPPQASNGNGPKPKQ